MVGESKAFGSKSARSWMLGALLACGLLFVTYFLRRPPDDEVHFSRDVRPILNQNCMPCHGGVRQKNGVAASRIKIRTWFFGDIEREIER